MSEILIGTVDDVFLLTGRGCVVVFTYNRLAKFKIGDEIKFVTSENRIISSKISGIEFIKYQPGVIPDYSKKGILLKDIEKHQQYLAKGAEIYLSLE